MRFRPLQCLSILAILAIATPIWARAKSVDLNLTDSATIGTTQLQPGDYQLRVEEGANQVTVVQHDKVIAEVPCHWVQLQSKPRSTEVNSSSNRITEVDFAGDIQAVQF
ncbi:MAG: hypothetical protein WB869_03665 [Candidatus Acidiferrales bacterium]